MSETLERVAVLYEQLLAHVEADRTERRALTDAFVALESLHRAPVAEHAVTPATSKIIGGTFYGLGSNLLIASTPTEPMTPDTVAVQPDRVVEVRCRFGDRWVDGFEVCELVADDDRVRYRLRRQVDGSVLPTLFDAADVREMRGEARDPLAAATRRRWTYR